MLNQNNVTQGYAKDNDLRGREQEILAEISQEVQFRPLELLWRSTWWGSEEIGAFHYRGTFNGRSAVLKVQGVKPSISEIDMLKSFARTNESKFVRPPQLFATLPWNDGKGYEALVLEDIGNHKVVPLGQLASPAQIGKFFQVFADYRLHCRNHPWVAKPVADSTFFRERFKKWRADGLRVYPDYPHRMPDDETTIDRAVEILVREYANVPLEFQHGHLSVYDLYEVGNQVVVLSNLFWSWRLPFYDALLGYHWFPYNSANDVPEITPEQLEQQRGLWLEHIYPLAGDNVGNQRLLQLAMLEREAAGLALDMYIVDPHKPIAVYTAESTRKRLKELIVHFS